jgi:hypothetical protein
LSAAGSPCRSREAENGDDRIFVPADPGEEAAAPARTFGVPSEIGIYIVGIL